MDAILLAIALGADGWLLLSVAWVQARQSGSWLLKPIDAFAPLLSTALVALALVLLSASGFCAAAAVLPRLRAPLWSSRALPLVANLVYCAHSAAAFTALEHTWTSRSSILGLFHPPRAECARHIAVALIGLAIAAAVLAFCAASTFEDAAQGCLATTLMLSAMAMLPVLHTFYLSFSVVPTSAGHRPCASEQAACSAGGARGDGGGSLASADTNRPATLAAVRSGIRFAEGTVRYRRRRWLGSCAVAALFSGSAMSYVLAMARAGSLVLRSETLSPPAAYVGLLFFGVALLIHWPPLAACADVWYSGELLLGFEPADAPRGSRQPLWAFLVLLLSISACAGGSSLLVAAAVVVKLEHGVEGGGAPPALDASMLRKCVLMDALASLASAL